MKNTNKKGFTLVELVIVIAVIAILAAVLIPTFTSVINRANQSAALQKIKAVVDEEYVEYVADEHDVPSFVVVTQTNGNFSSIEFKKDSSNGYSTIANGKYVTLDTNNNVYLVFTTEGYSVVTGKLTNTTLTVNVVDYTPAVVVGV